MINKRYNSFEKMFKRKLVRLTINPTQSGLIRFNQNYFNLAWFRLIQIKNLIPLWFGKRFRNGLNSLRLNFLYSLIIRKIHFFSFQIGKCISLLWLLCVFTFQLNKSVFYFTNEMNIQPNSLWVKVNKVQGCEIPKAP